MKYFYFFRDERLNYSLTTEKDRSFKKTEIIQLIRTKHNAVVDDVYRLLSN